ncbi:CocE/NonD family hydrolase [Mycobacterium sp. KBS0706]|uniref:CocE/NonD family hydrolase n=1 Tax=Mycobacterium sp. KBS0706 TaxID=2578109 RepID=UPI00110F7591|nr:CocE/NonD family hydrolase [Mycobacterium sp. KBS0706]TSD87676.1 CocE/NonD family hydrolase [Mycobacterium sp. KBS0706]
MPIRVEESIWIPLADGTRLAARLWLPEGAEAAPAPAVLEYIPYRKRDGTRGRDEPMHGWFAGQGYAAIRVDMRGTGESDGHMADEYLKQEQDDALEVIAWIAAQPWCTGAVGMMGKSWGGFNSLQVAARRPPALKAIITVYSTDHRYSDDIHYQGGCLLNDNLWWGAIMLAYQARPADPAIVGEGWRRQWLERLERMPFFPALWLRHQRYDEYWKHGSVCEDWSAIQCPVLAVGGWADSYTNAVPRLLAGLKVPRRGIIGPWGHVYPQDGAPGPAIGFLQEALRWWDQWLKGHDTGVMAEPMLRAFVEDWNAPVGSRAETKGCWVGEAEWPSPAIGPRRWALNAPGALADTAGAESDILVRSPLSHGKAAGEWMATGCPGELPVDQRLDDGAAQLFDTMPLNEAVEILGAPELLLDLASDAPVAQLAVRLCDVAPDGRSARVSYGVLNLTHRDGHEAPVPLEPGKRYQVRVKLNDCGHRFPAGHRIRIAIATGYWPTVWPAPYAATLTLRAGTSHLDLPVRQGGAGDVVFEPPVRGPAAPATQLSPGTIRRYSKQDHISGETTYVTEGIGGVFGEGILRFDEIDTTLAHSLKRELTIRDDDPLSARYVLTQSYEMGREGWRILIESRSVLTADLDRWHLTTELTAKENGQVVTERSWTEDIPRDLV